MTERKAHAAGQRKAAETDWERVDKMRDEDIDYSDIPPTSPELFAKAVVKDGAFEALQSLVGKGFAEESYKETLRNMRDEDKS